MKSSKVFFYLVFFLLIVFGLEAQITVKLNRPAPNRLMAEDLWSADLNNKTTESQMVYLHGEITERNEGLVARANSDVFEIPSGIKRVTSRNIGRIIDSWYKGNYRELISRTGKFPNGEYTICVSVISAESRETFDRDCFEQDIRIFGEPRLISPRDGEEIIKNPLFTWTPPAPVPSEDLHYTIYIVEMLEGQTAEQAIICNPPWFEEERIRGNAFRYPARGRSFEEGDYAWQIQMSGVAGSESAKSEIRTFVFLPAMDAAEAINIKLISPENEKEIVDPVVDFQWAPVNIPEVSYTLTIWNMPEDSADRITYLDNLKEENLDDINPFFRLKNIEYPYYIYMGNLRRRFLPGTYAWQVSTTSAKGNEVKSEIQTFSRRVSELVSRLDCEKIKAMLERLKGQYAAAMSKLLAIQNRLNSINDEISSKGDRLSRAEEEVRDLEQELNEQEEDLKKPLDYLKRIAGKDVSFTEYDSPEDLKNKAAGGDYIGMGGIGCIFNDAEEALSVFDKVESLTGKSIGAHVRELRKLKSQKEDTKKSLQRAKTEVRKLKTRINTLKTEVPKVEQQLAEAKNKTNELKNKINALINAYKECKLAFNEAQQNASAEIGATEETLEGLGNEGIPSLKEKTGKVKKLMKNCGGAECHSAADKKLKEAEKHRKRAEEMIKESRRKLDEAKKKIDKEPGESERLAKEARDLANKAAGEVRRAKESIEGLAENLKECNPGAKKDRKTLKRFKMNKIVETGFVQDGFTVEKHKENEENYRLAAEFTKLVAKLAEVLQAVSTLITQTAEIFIAEAVVGEAMPASKSDVVAVILDNWPKLVGKWRAMNMYYIVEGHYETKQTWKECDKCCKWVNKQSPISKGPTVREIIRSDVQIIGAGGESHVKRATNQSVGQLIAKTKSRARWK